MKKLDIRFDLQLVIAVATTITSVCALWVSVQQIKLAREQKEANAFPYISSSYNTSDVLLQENYTNDGLGPAFISKVEVEIGDTVYSGIAQPLEKFLDTLNFKNKPSFVKSDLLPGWVIKAGEKRMMYSIEFPKPADTANINAFNRIFNKRFGSLKRVVKIYYSDIYGNCWLYNSDAGLVERVKECPNKVLRR